MKRYLRYDANKTKNRNRKKMDINKWKLQQYASRGVNTYGVCAQQNSALVKQKSFMWMKGKNRVEEKPVKKQPMKRVLRCQLAIGSVSTTAADVIVFFYSENQAFHWTLKDTKSIFERRRRKKQIDFQRTFTESCFVVLFFSFWLMLFSQFVLHIQ